VNEQKLIEVAHTVRSVRCVGDDHSPICVDVRRVMQEAADAREHEIAAKILRLREMSSQAALAAKGSADQKNYFVSLGGAHMAEYLHRMVTLPPGGCGTCLGGKEVPSIVAPGQMTRCPDCADGVDESAVA
jgi:hypothetical protein